MVDFLVNFYKLGYRNTVLDLSHSNKMFGIQSKIYSWFFGGIVMWLSFYYLSFSGTCIIGNRTCQAVWYLYAYRQQSSTTPLSYQTVCNFIRIYKLSFFMVFVFFTLRCAMLLAQLFVGCSEEWRCKGKFILYCRLQGLSSQFLFLLLSAMWML